jgi:hypothetical protein
VALGVGETARPTGERAAAEPLEALIADILEPPIASVGALPMGSSSLASASPLARR